MGTFVALVGYLICQILFGLIRYFNEMIFPITCLLVAGLLILASINIVNKKLFLHKVFIVAYLVTIGLFIYSNIIDNQCTNDGEFCRNDT